MRIRSFFGDKGKKYQKTINLLLIAWKCGKIKMNICSEMLLCLFSDYNIKQRFHGKRNR